MKLFFCVCVIMQLAVANSKSVADLSKPCRISDPDLHGCYFNVLTKWKEYSSTGIPEYKIAPWNPIVLDVVHISQELNDLVSVDVIAKQAKLSGLSEVTIDRLKLDVENLAIEIEATFPHLQASTNFKFSGKIGGAPVELQGSLFGDITVLKVNLTGQFKLIQKEGVEYAVVKSLKPQMYIEHVHLEVTTKNPRDQSLADFIINPVNNNDRTLLDVFSPMYTKTAEDYLPSWVEQFLNQIPCARILVQ